MASLSLNELTNSKQWLASDCMCQLETCLTNLLRLTNSLWSFDEKKNIDMWSKAKHIEAQWCICVSVNCVITGSDNSMFNVTFSVPSHYLKQYLLILSIRYLGKKFCEIWIKFHFQPFSHLKMSSAKYWPFLSEPQYVEWPLYAKSSNVYLHTFLLSMNNWGSFQYHGVSNIANIMACRILPRSHQACHCS